MKNYSVLAENAPSAYLPNITDKNHDPAFSGSIRYTCRFDKAEGVCGIDLGTVGQTSHLWCNGKDMGVRICPPYSYNLEGALNEGENELVIEVFNTLANAVRDSFSAFMGIPASGLLGPIHWMKRETEKV